MKIDKTEKEARERFYQEYEKSKYGGGLRGEGLRTFLGQGGIGADPPEAAAMADYRAPIWRAVKAALGLEFKPEEPELPEVHRGDYFVHVASGKRFYIEDRVVKEPLVGPYLLVYKEVGGGSS